MITETVTVAVTDTVTMIMPVTCTVTALIPVYSDDDHASYMYSYSPDSSMPTEIVAVRNCSLTLTLT